MTTASKITVVRIAMIPLFIAAALVDWKYGNLAALIIFVLASVTDGVDGYVARKYNQVSDFGKFLDPLADKILILSAIMILVERGQMPSWCAVIIIAREFAVTGLRLVAVSGGVVIAAGLSGKIKTCASIVGVCFMLSRWHGVLLAGSWLSIDFLATAIIVITTVWSGVEYFIKNRKLIDFRR